jgi:hypothetical protein
MQLLDNHTLTALLLLRRRRRLWLGRTRLRRARLRRRELLLPDHHLTALLLLRRAQMRAKMLKNSPVLKRLPIYK